MLTNIGKGSGKYWKRVRKILEEGQKNILEKGQKNNGKGSEKYIGKGSEKYWKRVWKIMEKGQKNIGKGSEEKPRRWYNMYNLCINVAALEKSLTSAQLY